MARKSNKFSVEVQVVPTEGKISNKSVEVDTKGMSVGELLKSADITAEHKDILVNSKPATLDTYVGPEDKEQVVKIKISVTERPQGS